MAITVSMTVGKNGSNFDPVETDVPVEGTVNIASSDAGPVTFYTSVDGVDTAVFVGQNKEGSAVAPRGGADFTLSAKVGKGSDVTLSVSPNSPSKGTNGKLHVGSGSGDSFQAQR